MRRMQVLLAAVLLLLLLAPTAVHATATTFEAVVTNIAVAPPVEVVATPGLVTLVGIEQTGTLNGDLEGTVGVVITVQVNHHTGTGSLRGSFTIETAEATWTGTITGGAVSPTEATFTGVGDDGSRIVGRSRQSGNQVMLTGRIIRPAH